MVNVVGVRFKRAGKVYYFDPGELELEVNDKVIVQTARGLEIGDAVIAPSQVEASEIVEELKPVVRKAGVADIEKSKDNGKKAKAAMEVCVKYIKDLNLSMKRRGACGFPRVGA